MRTRIDDERIKLTRDRIKFLFQSRAKHSIMTAAAFFALTLVLVGGIGFIFTFLIRSSDSASPGQITFLVIIAVVELAALGALVVNVVKNMKLVRRIQNGDFRVCEDKLIDRQLIRRRPWYLYLFSLRNPYRYIMAADFSFSKHGRFSEDGGAYKANCYALQKGDMRMPGDGEDSLDICRQSARGDLFYLVITDDKKRGERILAVFNEKFYVWNDCPIDEEYSPEDQ